MQENAHILLKMQENVCIFLKMQENAHIFMKMQEYAHIFMKMQENALKELIFNEKYHLASKLTLNIIVLRIVPNWSI